jgi:hypothetical protein
MSGAVVADKVFAEGEPGGVKRRVVEGRSAGDSANSVSTEELFGHGRD